MSDIQTPYHRLGAIEALRGLRDGSLDLAEYTEALIERTAEFAYLNTYVSHDPDRIRRRIRDAGLSSGALAGLPFAVKDVIESEAYPTTAATPALHDWHPRVNATVLQSMLDAGGTLMGKQVPGELSFGFSGNNPKYGTVRNPYNPAMFSGGSSGGTAAGIAAGLVPAALGADTGGSCRMPAALCGCVGFRPTLGRYSQLGVIPVSSTRDTVGPLARRVADARLIDSICTGSAPDGSNASFADVRLGIPRARFYDDLDPEVARLTDEALGRMADAGAVIIERDIPSIDDLNSAVSFTVVLYEVVRELAAYFVHRGARFTVRDVAEHIAGPFEREMLASVLDFDAISAAQYREAIGVHRPRLQAAYADYFAAIDVDAIVVPTTALPARPHAEPGADRNVELNGRTVDTFFTYIRNCDPSSNAGLPCLSVPSGLTRDGLPVGLEFVGPSGADARLLDLGEAFERITEPLPAPLD